MFPSESEGNRCGLLALSDAFRRNLGGAFFRISLLVFISAAHNSGRCLPRATIPSEQRGVSPLSPTPIQGPTCCYLVNLVMRGQILREHQCSRCIVMEDSIDTCTRSDLSQNSFNREGLVEYQYVNNYKPLFVVKGKDDGFPCAKRVGENIERLYSRYMYVPIQQYWLRKLTLINTRFFPK